MIESTIPESTYNIIVEVLEQTTVDILRSIVYKTESNGNVHNFSVTLESPSYAKESIAGIYTSSFDKALETFNANLKKELKLKKYKYREIAIVRGLDARLDDINHGNF